MSAFVVPREHITYLVHAAIHCNAGGRIARVRFAGETIDAMNASAVGRALWAENIASVSHRYPTDSLAAGTLPGPIGLDHESLALYRCPVFPEKRFAVVTALKALDCYEYQSCEHPGWHDSAARAFCDHLRGVLIGELPGYDQAPWEIDADTRITEGAVMA